MPIHKQLRRRESPENVFCSEEDFLRTTESVKPCYRRNSGCSVLSPASLTAKSLQLQTASRARMDEVQLFLSSDRLALAPLYLLAEQALHETEHLCREEEKERTQHDLQVKRRPRKRADHPQKKRRRSRKGTEQSPTEEAQQGNYFPDNDDLGHPGLSAITPEVQVSGPCSPVQVTATPSPTGFSADMDGATDEAAVMPSLGPAPTPAVLRVEHIERTLVEEVSVKIDEKDDIGVGGGASLNIVGLMDRKVQKMGTSLDQDSNMENCENCVLNVGVKESTSTFEVDSRTCSLKRSIGDDMGQENCSIEKSVPERGEKEKTIDSTVTQTPVPPLSMEEEHALAIKTESIMASTCNEYFIKKQGEASLKLQVPSGIVVDNGGEHVADELADTPSSHQRRRISSSDDSSNEFDIPDSKNCGDTTYRVVSDQIMTDESEQDSVRKIPHYPLGTSVKRYCEVNRCWKIGCIVANDIREGEKMILCRIRFDDNCNRQRDNGTHDVMKLQKLSEDCDLLDKMVRLGQVIPGSRLAVYWPADDAYYPATVLEERRQSCKSFFLKYDDGEHEWINLWFNEFQLLEENMRPRRKRHINVAETVEFSFRKRIPRDHVNEAEREKEPLKSNDQRKIGVEKQPQMSEAKIVKKSGEGDTEKKASVGNDSPCDDAGARINNNLIRSPASKTNNSETGHTRVSTVGEKRPRGRPRGSSSEKSLIPSQRKKRLRSCNTGDDGHSEASITYTEESLSSSRRSTRAETKPKMSFSRKKEEIKIEFEKEDPKLRNPPTFDSISSSIDEAAEKNSSGTGLHGQASVFSIGDRVEVYWSGDRRYYSGTITKQRKGKNPFYLEYDDGDSEWIDFSKHKTRILEKKQLNEPPLEKDLTKKRKINSTEVSSVSSTTPKRQVDDIARIKVGTHVAVWWPEDHRYYRGVVTRMQRDANWRPFFLEYDDGDEEWIDFRQHKFRILSGAAEEEPVVSSGVDGASADVSQVYIGARLSVWWQEENEYFDCTVTRQRDHKRSFYLEYDDGDREWMDLNETKFFILSGNGKSGVSGHGTRSHRRRSCEKGWRYSPS